MIDFIMAGMQQECQALCDQDGGKFTGSYLLVTNFKEEDATYQFPLLMLDVMDGPDSQQYCGGASKMDWSFQLCVYGYDPNAYGDDSSGFSESLLQPIDIVRRHFCDRQWLTEGMTELEMNYGFRLTFGGVHRARALRHQDGLAKGFALNFGSVAVDDGTDKLCYNISLNTVTDDTFVPPPVL